MRLVEINGNLLFKGNSGNNNVACCPKPKKVQSPNYCGTTNTEDPKVQALALRNACRMLVADWYEKSRKA